MRSYLNSWKEIDGNPREVKRNGFERVWVSFGVKNGEGVFIDPQSEMPRST